VTQDRRAFGAFLRSRRDRLTPSQAGVGPFPGPRRVPGLRKEELAVLAGLSADHYSRLEQGRQATVTDDVLEALARALRLDDVERAHLRDLAASSASPRAVWEVAQRPDPGLLRVMTALDTVPALLLGRRGEVLARNALLPAVLGVPLLPGSCFLRWLCLDDQARARIVNWPQFVFATAGALRYELGRHPGDRALLDLIADLRSDSNVERAWQQQHVVDQTSVTKLVEHPVAGRLVFGIETVCLPHDPDQRLVVYTVEPGSSTAQALALLAVWGSDTVTTQAAPEA
jgi:transcriptional regulator with XRE-family HTH domain